MAEKNNYYGSGIFVAGNIDIGAIGKPADSRVMVPNPSGLDELVADKRVYDGMIVYCESTKTYHKCSVEWDSSMNITSSSWKQVEIQSLDELKALIAHESTAAMEFKGVISDGQLPTLSEGVNYDGNLYKITTKNVTIPAALNAEGGEADIVAKPGDSIVCEGGKWYLIPSGDDVEDTWRAIKVNGVEKLGIGTTTGAVDFVQGDNVTISEAGGVITIAAADTHYESKLVAANSNTDAEDEDAESGQVHLNLVEDGTVKSSHKIVGTGAVSVTHTKAEGEDGVNVITIDAPEGAKYDLAAKTENNEAILSLAGTDNTEDKVAIIGNDAVTVTVVDGKVKISAHDTTYTGEKNGEIEVTIEDGKVSAALVEVGLDKLAAAIQTKLGYIDTEKNITTAIKDAIDKLDLDFTYVPEAGFVDRVKGIKINNAGHADTADTATNATNANHASTADSATNATNATNAVNASEAAHATDADNATHAAAAGKVDNALTVKVGGADVVFDGSEAKTADVDGAIADAIGKIPPQTDYTVACTDEDIAATDSTPAFKRHTLNQNGKQVCTIDVPRDLVVKSGYVDKEKNELVLVLVNDAEIRVDVSHLIEYVTGGTATDGIITVDVDDNFVATATINNGTITEEKLHADVTAKLNKQWATTEQGAKADTALQSITSIAKDKEGNEINSGLKVTTENNVTNITLDDEVVFVLNCNY